MADKKFRFREELPPDLMGRQLSDAVVFFHEAVAAKLGMSAAEWKCLGLLEQHGSLAASRLSELSGFTTGAITGIVDRLESAGYVRRERHPTDRRSVIVRALQVKGLKEKIAPIFQSLGHAMHQLMLRYDQKELTAIASFLDQTAAILREQTANLKNARKV